MKTSLLYKTLTYLSVIIVFAIGLYSLVIQYNFPPEQANYLLSLFFLIASINHLAENDVSLVLKEKIATAFLNTNNILVITFLSVSFSLLLVQAQMPPIKIFIIILYLIVLCFLSLVLLNKKILTFLFWINFYLFMGGLLLSQIPEFNIDFLSKFNPFAGLIFTALN